MAKEVDPRQVFERLFGSHDVNETAAARAKRELYNKSILDFITEDANQLAGKLGGTDKRKLDEYRDAQDDLQTRGAHRLTRTR